MHSPDRVRRLCRELHAWLVSYYVVRCYLVGSSTYKQCTTKYRYQSREFVLTVYLYAFSQHLQLGLWHNIILFRSLLCRKYSSAIYQTLPSVTSYKNIVIYNVIKKRHQLQTILSFRYRGNSVHLHKCSPFGQVFSLLLTKKTTMFTVLYRHAHSDWKSAESFLHVIGKSNSM